MSNEEVNTQYKCTVLEYHDLYKWDGGGTPSQVIELQFFNRRSFEILGPHHIVTSPHNYIHSVHNCEFSTYFHTCWSESNLQPWVLGNTIRKLQPLTWCVIVIFQIGRVLISGQESPFTIWNIPIVHSGKTFHTQDSMVAQERFWEHVFLLILSHTDGQMSVSQLLFHVIPWTAMALVRASVRHCRLRLHVFATCPENTDELVFFQPDFFPSRWSRVGTSKIILDFDPVICLVRWIMGRIGKVGREVVKKFDYHDQWYFHWGSSVHYHY
jgi:hypothetical protein